MKTRSSMLRIAAAVTLTAGLCAVAPRAFAATDMERCQAAKLKAGSKRASDEAKCHENSIKKSLPLDDAYFQRLLRTFKGERAAVRVLPYSYQLAPQSALGLKEIVTQAFGPKSEVSIAPTLAFGEEDGIVEASGKGKKPPRGSPPPTTPAPSDPLPSDPSAGYPEQPAETLPWGIDRVWSGVQPAASGSGVRVAVLDTGIDLFHPDLKDHVIGNKTFVSGTSRDRKSDV